MQLKLEHYDDISDRDILISSICNALYSDVDMSLEDLLFCLIESNNVKEFDMNLEVCINIKEWFKKNAPSV